MVEVSLVRRSNLEGRLRVDPQYYRSEFLEMEEMLSRCDTKPLSLLASSIKSFGAYSLTNEVTYQESGIPFLRCIDLKPGYVDFSEVNHIDEESHELLWKSKVRPGQVLLAMSGSVGNSAVASDYWQYPMNSNQDIAKITPSPDIDPYYLSTFLNSRYGRFQTQRLPVGSVQQHIFLWQIGLIRVPLLEGVQERISELAKDAERQMEISIHKRTQTEKLLVEAAGLSNWKPPRLVSFVNSYKNVLENQRCDAEYFQPSYQQLFEKLEAKVELKELNEFVIGTQKGIEVGSENYTDEGKLFIRVSNLSDHGLLDRDQKYLSEDIYARLEGQFQPQVGELLLTKDATPGVAYVLKEPITGILSSGILRFKIDEGAIDNEYLACCINSIIGRTQVERDCGGSVIAHWRPDLIDKLKIPIPPDNTQSEIGALARESYLARTAAQRLLTQAQANIESAIERK